MFTPVMGKEKTDRTSWSIHPNGGFWSPNPHICMNGSYSFGEVAEGRKHVIIEGDDVKHYNLWDCYFTRQTLLEEVSPFGFVEAGFYSDVTGKPYAAESETLCAVLRKGE
jgi:hypothetical protein